MVNTGQQYDKTPLHPIWLPHRMLRKALVLVRETAQHFVTGICPITILTRLNVNISEYHSKVMAGFFR
jgi:hypothetical protein